MADSLSLVDEKHAVGAVHPAAGAAIKSAKDSEPDVASQANGLAANGCP
jgi:hypothetical protein